MKGLLLQLWSFRSFIFTSIRNEFRLRFIRSKFGGAWIFLHPLSQVLIYAIVLSGLMSARLPGMDGRYAYPIYLTSGILAWNLFNEILTRSLTVFIENANLLKKISFPRLSIVVIAAGSSLINHLILFTSTLVVFFFLGHNPGIWILAFPPVAILTLAFSVGLGLILGILNVFLRDIAQIVPILLQFVFWFTPVVYVETILPEWLRQYMVLNPLYHIVKIYRDIIIRNVAPDPLSLAVLVSLSLLLFFVAFFLYKKSSSEMVDAL